MMKRLLSGAVVGAMAFAGITLASANADAALVLDICSVQFCSSGTVLSVQDNQSGDLNPGAGRITALEGGVGGFNAFDVETAISQPADGVGDTPLLDITYQATGTGDVWLYLINDDFVGTGNATIKNDGNNSNGSITTNVATLYGPVSGGVIGTLVGFGSASFAFTAPDGAYPLILEYHLASSGTTTGDLAASVPEPASLTLLGLGFLGSAGAFRRRFSFKR